MRKRLFLFLIIALSGCSGFVDPGAGSLHHEPEAVLLGVPTQLDLGLIAIDGNPKNRFADVTCHYRLSTESEFMTLEMKQVGVDGNQVNFRCVLLAVANVECDYAEYYFSMTFDGVHTERHSASGGYCRVQVTKR